VTVKVDKNIYALTIGWFSALSIALALIPEFAFSQASFFQGKTITIVQGRDPGGTGDLRVRALVPFLQKYIPGNPTIIMEFVPGGGSRKAANQVYRSSRPDGLTIGNLSSGMVSLAILGESGVLYDIDKFHYLGSPYSSYHSVFVTRKDAGFDTLDKLRAATGVKIGGQSIGFSTYNEGRLFVYMLGLKGSTVHRRLRRRRARSGDDARRDRRPRHWPRYHRAAQPRLARQGFGEHSCDHGNTQRRQASPSNLRQASRDRDLRQERPRA
jgi:hypothetical protein